MTSQPLMSQKFTKIKISIMIDMDIIKNFQNRRKQFFFGLRQKS